MSNKQNEIINILRVAADFVLLAVNSEGVIESATPPIRALFKRQEGEVEGRLLTELIPGLALLSQHEYRPIQARGGMEIMGADEVAVSNCDFLEYLASFEQHKEHYETQVEIDAEKRWFELATYKLLQNNKIVFAVIISDITRRKNNEQAIKELNENLEKRVKERTAELQGRTEQIKNVVISCGSQLSHINQTYQSMKEKQMEIMEGLGDSILSSVSGLSELQIDHLKKILQTELVKCMNLYSEDQITDQKFMLTMMTLNELFSEATKESENLKPGQLGGTKQDEVDELLASLGI